MEGNIMNRFMESASQPAPKVGDGATICQFSDRKAGTIIEVSKSGKTIKIQLDDYRRVDENGMSDAQTYEYSPNPQGIVYEARLRNGKWKTLHTKYGVIIGRRDQHHDYSY